MKTLANTVQGMCKHCERGTLCYKPEGGGFENRCGEFFNYIILLAALGLGVHSASNRKEYQKQTNNNVSGM
jgi:hypothetical protein